METFGSSFGVVVLIVITAGIMFVFPMVTLGDRTDDITQMALQAETTEFGNMVATTGVLTIDDYAAFEQKITATGDTAYAIELAAQFTDENTGKKKTQANSSKIGEDEYVGQYHSQLMSTLDANKKIVFKVGDIFSISVKNLSPSIAEQVKYAFFAVQGNDIASKAAYYSVYVETNGE